MRAVEGRVNVVGKRVNGYPAADGMYRVQIDPGDRGGGIGGQITCLAELSQHKIGGVGDEAVAGEVDIVPVHGQARGGVLVRGQRTGEAVFRRSRNQARVEHGDMVVAGGQVGPRHENIAGRGQRYGGALG